MFLCLEVAFQRARENAAVVASRARSTTRVSFWAYGKQTYYHHVACCPHRRHETRDARAASSTMKASSTATPTDQRRKCLYVRTTRESTSTTPGGVHRTTQQTHISTAYIAYSRYQHVTTPMKCTPTTACLYICIYTALTHARVPNVLVSMGPRVAISAIRTHNLVKLFRRVVVLGLWHGPRKNQFGPIGLI